MEEISSHIEQNNINTKTGRINFYKSQLRVWKAKYYNNNQFQTIKFSEKGIQYTESQLKNLLQQCIDWKNNNDNIPENYVSTINNHVLQHYIQDNSKKPRFITLPQI